MDAASSVEHQRAGDSAELEVEGHNKKLAFGISVTQHWRCTALNWQR